MRLLVRPENSPPEASLGSRRSSRRSLERALLVLAVGLAAQPLVPGALAQEGCPRALNDASPGSAVDPPIALAATAQSAQKQLNFDTDRKPKAIRNLTVTSDRPLPDAITPTQINFDAVLSRSGDTLESADFPDPTFTQPRVSPDRTAITFSVCLNPQGIAAGKYVGAVTISGPAGLGSGSVNLTVSAKDGTLFWLGLGAALVASFALLLLKDAAAAYESNERKWRRALRVPLGDLRWWAATVIALATAFGILYAAYSNDPAWGATGIGAASSLVGSAFAAIGGQAILTSFKSSG